jgi:hypothetical protein
MSTLRITQVQDRVTGKEVLFQRAELNLNGTADANLIRSSKGVSSTTFLAQGQYRVNFVTGTFPDGEYIVAANCTSSQGGPDARIFVSRTNDAIIPATKESMTFLVFDEGGADPDPPNYVYLSWYY